MVDVHLTIYSQFITDVLWLTHTILVNLKFVHNFPLVPSRIGHTSYKRQTSLSFNSILPFGYFLVTEPGDRGIIYTFVYDVYEIIKIIYEPRK